MQVIKTPSAETYPCPWCAGEIAGRTLLGGPVAAHPLAFSALRRRCPGWPDSWLATKLGANAPCCRGRSLCLVRLVMVDFDLVGHDLSFFRSDLEPRGDKWVRFTSRTAATAMPPWQVATFDTQKGPALVHFLGPFKDLPALDAKDGYAERLLERVWPLLWAAFGFPLHRSVFPPLIDGVVPDGRDLIH